MGKDIYWQLSTTFRLLSRMKPRGSDHKEHRGGSWVGRYWRLCPYFPGRPGPCQNCLQRTKATLVLATSCPVIGHAGQLCKVVLSTGLPGNLRPLFVFFFFFFCPFLKNKFETQQMWYNVCNSRTQLEDLIGIVCVKKEWIPIVTAGLIQRFKYLTCGTFQNIRH